MSCCAQVCTCVFTQVFKSCSVVLCTNSGAGSYAMKQAGDFDVAVIDEAAQALEVSWPYISYDN